MKPVSYLLFLALILLVSPIHGVDTVTMQGRINWNGSDTSEVWIGVFDLPIRTGAEALSWTYIESSEFDLTVPDRDEVQLVVLCQDFMYYLKTVYPRSTNKQFDLQLARGITLEGTVLSTDKIPVADAVLTLVREDLPRVRIPEEYVFSWVSDADGRFKIGGLTPYFDYEVHVEVPYAYRENETFSVEVEESDIQDRDLRLFNAYFVLGRVLDEDHASVQDATVQFTAERPDGAEGSSTTTSNSNGEFKLGPFERATEISLSAAHEELGSSSEVQTTPGEHDVELVLESLVHVFGTVIDHATGKPIDDFTLIAIASHDSRPYSYSEAKGEISSKVDRETIGLIVDSADHTAYFLVDVDLQSVDEYDMGVIELLQGRQLTGRVYDVSSGQPVVGAWVSLEDYELNLQEKDSHWIGLLHGYLSNSAQSITDEEGAYKLVSLPARPTNISIFAVEYGRKVLQVDETVTVLDVPLEREFASARIRGEVVASTGEPVGGYVTFRSEMGSLSIGVGSDGKFDRAFSVGEYDIYAETDQGTSPKVQVVLEEDEIQEVTLVLESQGLLTGVIEGLADGETISLTIFSERDQIDVRSAHGLGNGGFTVKGTGFGDFKLTAESSRNRKQVKSFEVSTGVGEAHVVLYFAGQSRLYGSLRYPDGTVLKGKVRAEAQDSGKTSGSAEIDDDGTIEIDGLEDGDYKVIIFESKRLTMNTPDGGSRYTESIRPIEEVEVEVRSDTELNIQLTLPSDPD